MSAMEKTFKVYKHTCPNGKSYIGITSRDVKLRWHYGNGYATQLFGRAIKKYGWENIKHEILEDGLSFDEANVRETYYIEFYETTNPLKGYNCTRGGEGAPGHSLTEAAKRAIGEANKRKWRDSEYRERMLNHLQSVSKSNIGRKRSQDAIEKTLTATRKPIDQYSLDGEFVAAFKSAMDAARCVGQKNNSGIISCCKGKFATAHGYIWRYHGEPLEYEKHVERLKAWKTMTAKNAKAAVAENCIAIRQEDNDGNLVATYQSAAEAQKATGINRNSIRRCCNGCLKHAGGYVWKNIND